MSNNYIKEAPYLNPATYMLIDRLTGEEIDVKILMERCGSEYWEKAYSKTLSEYIGITGSASGKILSYLLKNKDNKNMINGTVRGIAKEISVSTGEISKIFKLLKEKDMLKTIRHGYYMLTPKMIRHGGKVRGVMMLRMWGEI